MESLLCKFRGRTEGGKSVLYCLHLLDIPIPEHKSDSRLERIRTCKSNSACKFQGTWLICQGSDRTLRNRTKIWILRFLFRIESKKFRFDKQNSKRFDIRLRHKWNWSCNLPEPQGAEPKRDKWCFVFLKTKNSKKFKRFKKFFKLKILKNLKILLFWSFGISEIVSFWHWKFVNSFPSTSKNFALHPSQKSETHFALGFEAHFENWKVSKNFNAKKKKQVVQN